MDLPINAPLPAWQLEAIHGEQVPQIKDFAGKPLLILLFNLGCAGCKGRAIPYANRVVYEQGEQIQVLGIHSNFKGALYTPEELQDAEKEFYMRFPLFQDADLNSTFHKFKAGGTPHWWLADRKGRLVYTIFGSDPNKGLLKLDYKIAEILAD